MGHYAAGGGGGRGVFEPHEFYSFKISFGFVSQSTAFEQKRVSRA